MSGRATHATEGVTFALQLARMLDSLLAAIEVAPTHSIVLKLICSYDLVA